MRPASPHNMVKKALTDVAYRDSRPARHINHLFWVAIIPNAALTSHYDEKKISLSQRSGPPLDAAYAPATPDDPGCRCAASARMVAQGRHASVHAEFYRFLCGDHQLYCVTGASARSQVLCSFQAIHADTRQAAAIMNNVSAMLTPALTNRL